VTRNFDDEGYEKRLVIDESRGPRITALRRLPIAGHSSGFLIHIADKHLPFVYRRKLAYVARVASRSTGYPCAFDGTLPDTSLRLFVAAKNSRVIAMAITVLEAESWFWKLGWSSNGSLTLQENNPTPGTHVTVSRVWTASTHRRQGVATGLVRFAAQHLQCNTADLAWEIPFTPSGAAIARRLSPSYVWGRGDSFAVQEALEMQVPAK
jgi:hypothetical protein